MKYSFIFCYRNREEHLNITIPRIREVMKNQDHEIIVVEQDDTRKFRRANLLNEGAKVATGDILIFHDIDYYPSDDVVYYDGISDVYLPVHKAIFVYNNFTEKPLEEVPGGYRHFRNGVDENFFGAVEVFKRDAFFKINGFSPLYVGWGFEDADLRERVQHYELSVMRGNCTFLALDHLDSGPSLFDSDFRYNMTRARQWKLDLDRGVKNQPAKVSEITPTHSLVDKWLLVTDFDGPLFIVSSNRNFED